MYTVSTPPAQAYRRMMSRLGWALLLFFGLFTVSTYAVEVVFLFLPSNSMAVRAAYGVFSTVGYAAPFLLSGLFFNILSRKEKGKLDSPFAAARPVNDRLILPPLFPLLIIAGLGLNLVVAQLNFYLCELIGFTSLIEADPVYYDSAASIILYMTTAIAPAFAEEFLFRGVIYGNLRPYGKWQAILISAMAFAFMHQNLGQLLYTFVGGIVMALMYEWTGSIWCGVIYHLFNNQFSVLSESLANGAYGQGAYAALGMWDLMMILLAIVSIVILAIYLPRRKRQLRKQAIDNPSIFGSNCPTEEGSIEVFDTPLDARSVRRGLRSPGMMVFMIYSAVSIFGTYFLVLLANLLGGTP